MFVKIPSGGKKRCSYVLQTLITNDQNLYPKDRPPDQIPVVSKRPYLTYPVFAKGVT